MSAQIIELPRRDVPGTKIFKTAVDTAYYRAVQDALAFIRNTDLAGYERASKDELAAGAATIAAEILDTAVIELRRAADAKTLRIQSRH